MTEPAPVYRRGTNPKLTEDQVREIRQKYAERASTGIIMADLAYEYGVTQPNIQAIVSRRSWRWVK